MGHSFEKDQDGYLQKFVTIRDDSGEFHTLLHAPFLQDGRHALKQHDDLMQKFLKSSGITDEPLPELRAFQGNIMGGGRRTGSDIDWDSRTLQTAIGRDRPEDIALANLLIAEIREYVKNLL